jgi:hypothetical protein
VVQLNTPGADADAQPMEQQPDLQQGMASSQGDFLIQWNQATHGAARTGCVCLVWFGFATTWGLVAHLAMQDPPATREFCYK